MARIYTINTKRYEFVDVDSAVATTYQLTEDDHNKWIKLDTTTSSVNLNLPTGLSDGFRCVVENTGNTTVNYVNAVGTTIATQQDKFTEDQYRTTEIVFNEPTSEWRVQGFVGRNDISSLYDVNTAANGVPQIGDVLQFDGAIWTTGANPPYIPGNLVTVDRILTDEDHGKIIHVDSSAIPVDIAINTGLTEGFYCRVINVGTGSVTFTPAVTFNSAVVALNDQYSYVDIWHAGLEQYYVVTSSTGNVGAAGTGNSGYSDINSVAGTASANGVDSIAIGPTATTGALATSAIAIGPSSEVTNVGGIVLGSGLVVGNNGIAIGTFAGANTDGVAIGRGTDADAGNTAIGFNANASSTDTVQIHSGTNTNASTIQFRNTTLAHSTYGIKAATGTVDPPADPELTFGYLFYNSTDAVLKYYDGANWLDAAASPFLSISSSLFTNVPSGFPLLAGNILLGPNTVCGNTTGQVVIGATATSGDSDTVSIGFAASADGLYSICVGANSSVLADNATGLGENVSIDAAANNALALGKNANVGAAGLNAVQLGAGTNNVANSLQYLGTTIANSNGIQADTVTTAPTAPADAGTMKFDTVTDTLYIHNGTSWVSVALS